MANFGEVVVVYDILPEVAAKMEEILSEIVRKAAFDIVGHAMANLNMVTVRRTGFLINSLYCAVGAGENEHPYSNVQAPSERGQELLPEVQKPGKPTEAIVAVGANYGAYIEFGTAHMGPRPYFTPAVEYVAPQFMHALEQLEAKLAESIVISGGGEGS